MTDLSLLDIDLARDEGERLKPYIDTVGKITISIGVNLSDGITPEESIALYTRRRDAVIVDAGQRMPWLATCPEKVQRGVVNMLYNLGWPRLSKFTSMLAALQKGDYGTAAKEAMNSTWAAQVGDRAVRISNLFKSVGA